jgi:hypothetical protein
MAWMIQVKKKTRTTRTRSARLVAWCSCFGNILTIIQEGHGFVVDEDEDDEEEVSRKERRRRKKRKNREEDEALDDEDLDLIGIDVAPQETQQVRTSCCLHVHC